MGNIPYGVVRLGDRQSEHASSLGLTMPMAFDVKAHSLLFPLALEAIAYVALHAAGRSVDLYQDSLLEI